MSGITIPPAALEAGAKELAMNCRCELVCDWRNYMDDARAAFVAMVTAWEGMHTHEWQRPWLGGMSGTDLILPLAQTQEDGDD